MNQTSDGVLWHFKTALAHTSFGELPSARRAYQPSRTCDGFISMLMMPFFTLLHLQLIRMKTARNISTSLFYPFILEVWLATQQPWNLKWSQFPQLSILQWLPWNLEWSLPYPYIQLLRMKTALNISTSLFHRFILEVWLATQQPWNLKWYQTPQHSILQWLPRNLRWSLFPTRLSFLQRLPF